MDNLNETVETTTQKEMTETKGKKKKKISYPTKDKINFAEIGVAPMKLEVLIPGIVIIVVCASLLSKFFVVDRFVAYSKLSSEVSSLQSRLDDANEKISSYGELEEEYSHYTYSGMTEEELILQDRKEVVELINHYILDKANVGSWSISGNEVNIPITGVTFQEIGGIVADLEQDEMVDHCEVVAASTSDEGVVYDSTTSDISALSGTSGATAQVTIYLVDDEDESVSADANSASSTEQTENTSESEVE
ncbi:MAG: hypothetical protein K5675_00300 [Lachnospiraceae bacterium]|nr:hypothetical protein [Lachnospiraceae bacterium]